MGQDKLRDFSTKKCSEVKIPLEHFGGDVGE